MQRLSVPFFFEPNYDAFIEPLSPERRNDSPTVGSETAGESRGITYGDHLVSKTKSNFDFSIGSNSKL